MQLHQIFSCLSFPLLVLSAVQTSTNSTDNRPEKKLSKLEKSTERIIYKQTGRKFGPDWSLKQRSLLKWMRVEWEKSRENHGQRGSDNLMEKFDSSKWVLYHKNATCHVEDISSGTWQSEEKCQKMRAIFHFAD